jgi:hypothetical protein
MKRCMYGKEIYGSIIEEIVVFGYNLDRPGFLVHPMFCLLCGPCTASEGERPVPRAQTRTAPSEAEQRTRETS